MNAAAIALAMFAITFRALIPVGFMVGPDQAGSVAVVICTGHGPASVEIDLSGSRSSDAPSKGHPSHSNAPCAFAVASSLGRSDAFIHFAPVLRVSKTAIVPSRLGIVQLGLLAPPPPARGPPLLI